MASGLTVVTDRLFDGARFREGGWLVSVREGRVAELVPFGGGPLPAGSLDARGATVLPGLIDAHAHIARAGQFEAHEPPNPAAVVHNLRAMLEGGVTTVGDMGSTSAMIRTLRSLTDGDLAAGPAIRGAGPLLSSPGGYPLDWMSPLHRALRAGIACADERSARNTVRWLAEQGMDHVKLCTMHVSYAYRPLPVFPLTVARAVVAEAHALGLRVFAHAHSNDDYLLALEAGVDALMHSAFDPLPRETVARVRDAGVCVCPTLWVFESVCLGPVERWAQDASRTAGLVGAVRRSWARFEEAWAASGDVLPEGIAGGLPKETAREGVRNAAANLKLLREARVPLAHGSDAPYGYSALGRPADELAALVRAGLTADEALAAATQGAARLLGLTDRGSLCPGSQADLLVVDGHLDADLAALRRPRHVYRRGERVGPETAFSLARAAAVAKGMLGSVVDALATRGRFSGASA